MGFLKGLLSAVLILILFVCLIAFSFSYTADTFFLSERFYKQTLVETGLYDRIYDDFVERNEKLAAHYLYEGPVTEWFLEGLRGEQALEAAAKVFQNTAAGHHSYVMGDAEQLPAINLEGLFAAVKKDMRDSLDTETARLFLNEETYGHNAAVLLSQINDADAKGEFPIELKEACVELVFENTASLDKAFLITTSEEAYNYLDYNNAKDVFETLRKYVPVIHPLIHQYMYPLLLVIAFLTGILLLIWLKKIWKGFLINGWTYLIASIIVIVVGMLVKYSDMLYNFMLGWLDTETTDILKMWNAEQLKVFYGQSVISIGLIFFGVAVVCMVLGVIFKKRKSKVAAE